MSIRPLSFRAAAKILSCARSTEAMKRFFSTLGRIGSPLIFVVFLLFLPIAGITWGLCAEGSLVTAEGILGATFLWMVFFLSACLVYKVAPDKPSKRLTWGMLFYAFGAGLFERLLGGMFGGRSSSGRGGFRRGGGSSGGGGASGRF